MNFPLFDQFQALVRARPELLVAGWFALLSVWWLLPRRASIKRFLFPFWIVAGAVLVLGGFAAVSTGPKNVLPVAAIFLAGIMLYNFLSTRFCSGCGRTLVRQSVIPRARFCSHCGKELL